jgi:hypothetical protein
MYKFVIVYKDELEKGEEEESGEHGFPEPIAHQVAIDHLTKKNPHYYSIADKVGLEEVLQEWYDSVFTPEKTGGRMARIKRYKKKHPKTAFTVVGGSNLFGK